MENYATYLTLETLQDSKTGTTHMPGKNALGKTSFGSKPRQLSMQFFYGILA